MAGQVLDRRYAIVKKVGEGGMSYVYLARDVVTDTRYAIKILSPALSKGATAMARLRREAVLLVAPIPAADAQQPRLAAPSRADSLLAQGRLAAAEHALYAAADAKPRDLSARGARGTRWQIDACAATIRVDHP